MVSSTSIPDHDPFKAITPELLQKICDIYYYWPKNAPLDASEVGNLRINGVPDLGPALYDICFETILRPISTIGVSNIPTDLLQYLPPPNSPFFPAQAIGLIILFDQVPRMTCKGTDIRYVFGYFDILAQRLRAQLTALPPHLRLETAHRWTTLGYNFEHAMLRRNTVVLPWGHSEDLSHHALLHTHNISLSSEIESHHHVRDPLRSHPEDPTDIYAFQRTIERGPPLGPSVTMADYFFFSLLVDRVHEPVVSVFGRYPYRNGALGRGDTEEEKVYLERSGWFLAPSEGVRERIGRDVRRGIWRGLRGRMMEKGGA